MDEKKIIEIIAKGILNNYFNSIRTDVNYDKEKKVLKMEVSF